MISKTDKRIVPQPNKLVCSPQKHCTLKGLQFWYDHDTRRIVTENSDISLNFVQTRGMDAVMYVYLKMPNLSIQVGQRGSKPFPPIVYQGPKQETVWEIGSLGSPLYFDTLTQGYRTRQPSEGASRLRPVAVDRHFASMEQQETAINLITETLQE